MSSKPDHKFRYPPVQSIRPCAVALVSGAVGSCPVIDGVASKPSGTTSDLTSSYVFVWVTCHEVVIAYATAPSEQWQHDNAL